MRGEREGGKGGREREGREGRKGGREDKDKRRVDDKDKGT